MNDDDYYGLYRDEEETNVEKEKPKKERKPFNKKIIIGIFGIIIIAALIVGIYFLIKTIKNNNNNEKNIAFNIEQMAINVGDTKDLKQYLNTQNIKYQLLWNTSNLEISEISQEGIFNAIKQGETQITITYIDNDGNALSSSCNITIIDDGNGNNGNNNNTAKVDINVNSSGNNGWNNKNVTLTVNASGEDNIANLKYTVNCSGNSCKFTNISNSGTITISNNGNNNVRIIATTNTGATKEVSKLVKIDKVAPTINVTVNDKDYAPNIYDNTGNVKVCTICKDGLSGCPKNNNCETITTTKQNYKVSVKTTLKATYNDTGGSGLYYYGFNSKYLGSNQLSTTITKLEYTYYVKDNAGNTNSCSIKLKQVINNGQTTYEVN